ncbi:unnamed protein product, partial [marine sediment metagenome]
MLKVGCIFLTLNEETDVEQCLKQFRPYVDYLFVLDGGSTDKTVEIAKRIADEVKVKPFSGKFCDEKNYAWSLLPKDCDWV